MLTGTQRNIELAVSRYLAGQPHPFSPAWYAQHPQAWQYAHPHADVWAAATWAAVTGWVVGVANAPVGYGYSETVLYNDTPPPSNSAQPQQEQSASATALAAAGPSEATDEPWLPLGVFALVPGQRDSAHMLLQLSISKSGSIGGSYYNVISNNSQPVSGSLDQETQQVAWTVAQNHAVVFHTDLASLTQDEAPVLVHFNQDTTERWLLVRLGQPADPMVGTHGQ